MCPHATIYAEQVMLYMRKKEPDAVGDYHSEAGISVEHVPEVVDPKTLNRREISHIFNTGWDVGAVSGKNGEFAVFYESDQKLHEHELNKID